MRPPVQWSAWSQEAVVVANPRPVSKLNLEKPADWTEERWVAFLERLDKIIDTYNQVLDTEGEEAANAYLARLEQEPHQ